MTTVLKAGRYEIVGEVGRGAMGVVYKAVDPVIGRTVAVKTIRLSEAGTGLSRPELLARFQTEARAAGLLTHPNIVVVYDAGEEDGLYYITMEMVEGKSVQALLDEGQKFSLPRVLRIMEQTCSALQFAHERHVVHRDIKPANLMLTADDTVKVTDFGTAKILQMGTVQQTTHVMGTPSYMSPEQVKGRAVDGRSDIFSLGVMLYEMVTGEKPFPGQNITTVIYKIVNEDPVPPRQVDSSIHPGISAVIMKALVKDPEERYQNCREMLEDLRNYRANAGIAGNPQATAMLGSASPSATLPLGVNGRQASGPNDTPVSSAARSLSARGANPGTTPLIRRTGAIAPLAEEKKPQSPWVTLLLALPLLGVIAWGANKLQPVFLATRDLRDAAAEQKSTAPKVSTPAENSGAKPSTIPAAAANSPASPATSATSPVTAPVETSAVPPANAGTTNKVAESVPEKVGVKSPDAVKAESPKLESVKTESVKTEPAKADSGLSPQAAAFKTRIDAVLAERGLSGRATVQGVGNTLTLSGKLRPAEYGSLLSFLHSGPPSVKLIDHIDNDASNSSKAAEAAGAAANRGTIHVTANVPGATASLFGPAGKQLQQCQTPCNLDNLAGASYSLEVKKDGYRTLQTAVGVKAGAVQEQKVNLESLELGIRVISEPPGADVWINGAKQSGQTPVVLPLAPGGYNLVLRLNGYASYSGPIQVKENVLTEFNQPLHAKDMSKVAWAEVSSNPPGAEIVVDGSTTSQVTPSRIQVSAGLHLITLKMKGFQPARRRLEVSEGGTVSVEAELKATK